MTAEIAILNKSAVALAADSAVTISAGSDQQKIFDSEDKLFELTSSNAIGVMINNTMHFMEAPLSVLIKKFREDSPKFKTVEKAAQSFLSYLNDFVEKSPQRIQDDAVSLAARTNFNWVNNRAQQAFKEWLFEPDSSNLRPEFLEQPDTLKDKIPQMMLSLLDQQLNVFERVCRIMEDAQFVGDGEPEFTPDQRQTVEAIAREIFPLASPEQRARAVSLLERTSRKIGAPGDSTGLVIAGFGSDELFPTLIAFELYGAFGGRLRYRRVETVDIDRDGDRARVLPFAQREMVERFLYGLDGSIEGKIKTESRSAVALINERIMGALEMPDEERQALHDTIKEAEGEVATGLASVFEAIRADSRSEIEDMVEFMPKAEMARMAEALVNLTSIKRRVSRGFETVGGPIDVAVISRAEGFVWVSRKHYFPRELNDRYFTRMAQRRSDPGGEHA